MKTYFMKIGERQIGLHMKKETAERFARLVGKVRGIAQHRRELTGLIDGPPEDQRSFDMWTPFGPSGSPIREPEAWAEFCKGMEADMPAEFRDDATLAEWSQRLRDAFERHIPISDQRETTAQRAEQNRQGEEAAEKERERMAAKNKMVLDRYGSGETKEVPPDCTMIVMQLTYDNSDVMTDYFDRHATFGPSLLLAVLPGKARQTEAAARAACANYPELAALLPHFTWHTETYSMGHGNYLHGPQPEDGLTIPEGTGLHGAGGGRFSIEIQFSGTYRKGATCHTFKGYGTAPEVAGDDVTTAAGVTENREKGGVEIRFESKPPAETLGRLKARGWRWSRFSHCWYKKAAPGVLQEALSLSGSGTQVHVPEDAELAACVAAGLGESRDFCPSDNA